MHYQSIIDAHKMSVQKSQKIHESISDNGDGICGHFITIRGRNLEVRVLAIMIWPPLLS